MTLRIPAPIAVSPAAACARFVLGPAIVMRTGAMERRLKSGVESVWGEAQVQAAPAAYLRRENGDETRQGNENKPRRVTRAPVELESARAHAGLNLEQGQKGLMRYGKYRAAFAGEHGFRDPGECAEEISVCFELAGEEGRLRGWRARPDTQSGGRQGLAARMAVLQPADWNGDRRDDAGEAPAGSARGRDERLRARVAAVFFRASHDHGSARHRAAPDELLLPGGGVFRLPPAACIAGRSRFGARRFRDLAAGFRRSRRPLSAPCGGPAVRRG